MVYLIVFVEAARHLRDVVTVGSNEPYVSVNFQGKVHRTGVAHDGKDPGTSPRLAATPAANTTAPTSFVAPTRGR